MSKFIAIVLAVATATAVPAFAASEPPAPPDSVAAAVSSAAVAPDSAAAFSPATAPQDSAAEPLRRSLGARQVILAPGGRVRTLPDRFILPGTETVTAGDTLLTRGLDYDLDHDGGVLRLRADHAADSVRVSYRRVPISIAPRFALREPVAAGSDTTPAVAAAVPPLEPGEGSKLSLFGSKTFGIEVGNQRDLSVTQALDLTVRGTVARDVEVLAILSDRNTPLLPEGNTTELQELDKVLVQVNGRGVGATMGDLSVDLSGSEFARVERKLEGASARAERDGWSFEADGAVSRGQYRSLEIRGTEGKQGPYALADASGARITVLAGTERVWLDGAPLTRGDKADYTIDYSLGEVTFTSKRPITAASRISIDYEYSDEAYRRRFYALTGGGSAAGGALTVKTTYVSESDDRSAPRQAALSEEDKQILRDAGDRIGSEGAVVYVGTGGDYRRVEDGAAGAAPSVHYEYAGEGLGDYRVRFRRAPAGEGAYVDSLAGSTTIYRYVGPGLGPYEPGVDLPLPRAHDVSDVAMEYHAGAPAAPGAAGAPGGAGLVVRGEGAYSRDDLNTFSSLGDGDNNGGAYHLSAEVSTPALAAAGRSLGILRVRGSARQVDSRFSSLGRLEDGFSNEAWDAAAAGFGADRRFEGGLDYYPKASTRFYTEGGHLEAPGGFTSQRRAFGVESSGRLTLAAKSERADADSGGVAGQRTADRLDASTRFGFLVPSVHLRRERATAAGDTTGAGAGFREVGGTLHATLARPLEIDVGVQSRRDELRSAAGWGTSGLSLAQRYGVQVSRWHALTANALYSHTRYEGRGGQASSTSDLGQLTLLHEAGRGGVTHEANVEITTTDLARRTREVVFVGTGLGHYDELGRFVGTGGDYEIRTGETVASDLTSRVDATFSSDIRPERFLDVGSRSAWLRALRSGTQIRLSETSDRAASHVLGRLGRFDESTVTGSFLWRQELELFPSGRALSLLARHESESHRDRQYTNIASRTGRREEMLRARSVFLPSVTAEIEQHWKIEDEQSSLTSGLGTLADGSTLHSDLTAVTFTYTPVSAVRAQLAGSLGQERVPGAPGRNRVWQGGPSLSTTFGSRGRVEANMVWTVVDGSLDVRRFLPASTTGREGMQWSMLLDYRLSTRTNALISADGQRPKIGSAVTTGRIEMRASF